MAVAPLPHWEVSFDEQGRPNQGEADRLLAELPGRDLTDLFVFAHGWNSDRGQARRLYDLYFGQVPDQLARGGGAARAGWVGAGWVGVVWQSKRWVDEPEPTADTGGGAAGLGDATAAAPPADPALVEDLKDVFVGGDQRRALDELARLLATRPEDPAALARFQALMGELSATPDAAPAGEDQGETALLSDDPRRCSAASPTPCPRPARAARPGWATPSGGCGRGPRRRCASSPSSR